MSYKTDRLTDLFPEAYAARDQASLLYKLLDAIGAELMQADEAIKGLLKSHWVNYASGPALDGLAAIYGVERRRVRGGQLETDDAFRQRLKSVVPLFTGGGTKQAVLGAVRSGSSRQGCASYEVKVLCRQLPDSDGKHIRGVGR